MIITTNQPKTVHVTLSPAAQRVESTAPMRPKSVFFLAGELLGDLFPPDSLRELCQMLDLLADPVTEKGSVVDFDRLPLEQAELIVSGWGMPKLDSAMLAKMPSLKAVFYAAGSVAGWITPAVWDRKIQVVTASAANAVPVAEYSASMIFLCLKRIFHAARETRRARAFWQARKGSAGAGGYGSTVGLLSLGLIGRLTVERLRGSDLKLLAHDPFLTEADARSLGVTRVSLEDLFAKSDVVSIHTPWLPETEGLVTGKLLASMRPNASIINTARGAVVRHDELIGILQTRPDIQAVLDVTFPEPPPADSPLYDLPNVIITPHIAGSVGRECARMGQLIVDEVRRYVTGQPLRHSVEPAVVTRSAHGAPRV